MGLRLFRTLLLLMIVIALYVVSFREPAIYFRQMSNGINHTQYPVGHVVKMGRQMALGSLLGPIFGNFAVLANPLLIVGCVLILLKRTQQAVTCLALALLFALQTFQMMVVPYHEDEGGVVLSYMVYPLVGWYCWFGAILLALLLAMEQKQAMRRGPTSE